MKKLKEVLEQETVKPYTGDGVNRVLRTGKDGSVHSKNPATGQSIPGASIGTEIDVGQAVNVVGEVANVGLGLANLGLGVANLGVGLFNAYQIHKTKGKVEEEAAETRRHLGEVKEALTDGLQSVHEVLQYQNQFLNQISESQHRQELRLEQLGAKLEKGIEVLARGQEIISKKRRNDQYLEYATRLHRARKKTSEFLIFQDELQSEEIEPLEAAATDFASYLESRLQSPDVNVFARQPYMLALSDATMAEVDALLLKDASRYRRQALYKLENLRDRYAKEVERLHDGATPWEVLCTARWQTENYAMVNRSVSKSIQALEEPDRECDFSVRVWDDELPEHQLGSTLADEPDNRSGLKLNGFDDYAWFVEAFDVDRENFPVTDVREVTPELAAKRLGAKTTELNVPSLKSFLKPAAWQAYSRNVEQEFGVEVDVRLAAVDKATLLEQEKLAAEFRTQNTVAETSEEERGGRIEGREQPKTLVTDEEGSSIGGSARIHIRPTGGHNTARHHREKPHLTVATVGQEGHGKTTLTAAIAKVLGEKPGSRADQSNIGGVRRGKTNNLVTHVEYETEQRHYTHLDCPGGKDGVPQTARNLAQADGMILVVSAADGPTPQIREALILAKQAEVESVAVFINKSDMVTEPGSLESVEADIRQLLDTYDWDSDSASFVRGSAQRALKGDRAATNQIETLLQAIDEDMPTRQVNTDGSLLMSVGEVFEVPGRGTSVTGYVEGGSLEPGDQVEIVGFSQNQVATVSAIEVFGKSVQRALTGDVVGCVLDGVAVDDIEPGQLLTASGTKRAYTSFGAESYVLETEEGGRVEPFYNGYQPTFYFRTAEVAGEIQLEADVEPVMPGDHLACTVELNSPVVVEPGLRFVFRDPDRTVGAGVVTEVGW